MQLEHKTSADNNRIRGECLILSSLPGKALRMRVEKRGLPSDSTYVLEAEPSKPDIRHFSVTVDLRICKV